MLCKRFAKPKLNLYVLFNIRAAEISNKRIFVFYQHISHVGLTPTVYNLGLEIGFILVSSRIGTINDGAPETLKTKTWIRSK